MNWYNVVQASEITGKSVRTVRWYLQKWKEANISKSKEQSMYRYQFNDAGTKILQVSELFLQACFNVDLPGVQDAMQDTMQASPDKTIEKELKQKEKEADREAELKGYFEKQLLEKEKQLLDRDKQLQDIKDAKNETIEVLKLQVDGLDKKLNTVLEQYALAQITISNLIPGQQEPLVITPEAEDIQEIIDEQQKDVGLTTTREYYEKKGFGDWLEDLDE